MYQNTNYFLTLLLTISLLFIIFFFPILDLFDHNLWSTRYLDCIIKNEQHCYLLSKQPTSHSRSSLWFAREYLDNGFYDKARTLIIDLVNQGNPDALNIMGQAFAAQNDFKAAKESWINAGAFQQAMEAAKRATENGKFDNALLAYEAAQFINPEEGTLDLADFLWFPYEDQSYAEHILQKTIWENPDSPKVISWKNRLGKLYRDQQRWNDAYNIYVQILSEYPNDWQATVGLGWAVYNRGNGVEAAQELFLQAIELKPERWNAYYAIGSIHAKEERYNVADLWFDQAIQHYPTFLPLYIERANTLRASGNFNKAIQVYREANEKFPNIPLVYFEIAWAYRKNNAQQEAVQAIEMAITLMEDKNPWYFTRAGLIYEWKGDLPKAHDAYSKAIEIDPTNLVAKDGKRRTERLPED